VEVVCVWDVMLTQALSLKTVNAGNISARETLAIPLLKPVASPWDSCTSSMGCWLAALIVTICQLELFSVAGTLEGVEARN
jgi:hypothetical protein